MESGYVTCIIQQLASFGVNIMQRLVTLQTYSHPLASSSGLGFAGAFVDVVPDA